jgi:hypothetical protein
LSLYVVDLVIFITLVEKDISLVCGILNSFGGASGLHTNVSKCQYTLIQCSNEQIGHPLDIVEADKEVGQTRQIYSLVETTLQAPTVVKASIAVSLAIWTT